MNKTEWYGARTVYRHLSKDETLKPSLYEERVIIVKAISFDDAIIQAEKEANEYACEGSDVKYLGYVNVFKLFKHLLPHTITCLGQQIPY
jgi:hypothetical protein